MDSHFHGNDRHKQNRRCLCYIKQTQSVLRKRETKFKRLVDPLTAIADTAQLAARRFIIQTSKKTLRFLKRKVFFICIKAGLFVSEIGK
jgi:hypothetical protein